MKRFAETHGPVFELTRHFVSRTFDSDLFATPGQWRPVALGCLAMLLTARIALIAMLSPRASLLAAGAAASAETFAEAAPMVFLMAVCGLVAIVQWQMLLPTRRDYLALAALPIHPRDVFLARFAAFFIFATAIVAALNILPALLSPSPMMSAVTWSLACYFPMFAVMALQGALLNLLPGRLLARIAPLVQSILGCALLLAVLGSFHINAWAADGESLLRRYSWAPPFWFVGLEQWLRGSADPFTQALGKRALAGFAACAGLALAAYFVSYRRYRRLLVESPEIAPSRSVHRGPVDLIARDPREAAIFHFLYATMMRSRTHRMVLLGYGGAAAGILINSLLIAEASTRWHATTGYLLKFMVYFWPVVASMLLIPGLRHAFRMPAEWSANWLFRITESQGRAQWMSAVERAVVIYAIVPIYLLDAPAAVAALGWGLGARVVTLQILTSLTIFEALFYSWQQLPFTCSYAPGERSIMTILGKYMGAIFFVAPPLAVLTAVYSQLPATFAIIGVACVAAWLRVRHMRRRGWGESKLIYEDDPTALLTLRLKS